MAVESEHLGASEVIVNQSFKNLDVLKIKKRNSTPIILRVSSFNFKERIKSRVSFFNIAGGKTMSNLSKVLDRTVYRVVLTFPFNGVC